MSANDFIFKPVNLAQKIACQAFHSSDIVFLLGPAGSGKTHCALGLAASRAIKEGKTRLIVSRPVVPAGESLGFLPGKLEQKMHPWLLPLHDVLRRMTFDKPEQWIKENCEISPLSFMRGRTFDRSIAILDEAQNASYEQLLLFLTRIGQGGKLLIAGDPSQSDRPDSGLNSITSKLLSNPIDRVSVVNLADEINPRHELIPKILSTLSSPTRQEHPR